MNIWRCVNIGNVKFLKATWKINLCSAIVLIQIVFNATI